MNKDLEKIVKGLEGVILAAKLPDKEEATGRLCPGKIGCHPYARPCPLHDPVKLCLRKYVATCKSHDVAGGPCRDCNLGIDLTMIDRIDEGIAVAISLKDVTTLVETVRAMDKKGVSRPVK